MEKGRAHPGAASNRCGAPGKGLKAINSGVSADVGLHLALAAFYAAADKMPEAKAALTEAVKFNPKLSAAWRRAHQPRVFGSPPGVRKP